MADLKEIVLPDGSTRRLGNNPAKPRFGAIPVYGQVPNTPLIPRSEWIPRIDQMGNDWSDPYLGPVHDQDGIGMCFPAGTLIRMADGSQKPIEDVKVLDKVLTAEGNVKRVTRTMVRRERKAIYKLHAWGHRHLRATAEHPVLTKRGYVRIKDLTRKDMIALPKHCPEETKLITPADYITGRVYTNRGSASRTMHIPGKRAVVIVRHAMPDVIHLTKDFGWLVGMFLAEGSTSHGKMQWTIGSHETDTIGTRIAELVKRCLGAEVSVRTNESRHTTNVTLYGVHWAKLFEALCSVGCDGKTLHRHLSSGTKEFLAGVLDGWTTGDGLGPDREGGVTTSHKLAMNMLDVANVLGLMPTVETLDVKVNPDHGVKSRRRRYIVRWGKAKKENDPRRHQTDKYLFRRVDGVVKEEFDGWVYNLEVAGDHSYVAEGIGVHNCNASATCSALEYQRTVQGLPYVALSGGDLYMRICGGTDQGSTLEDGIAASMAEGVSSVKYVPYLDWRGENSGAREDRKNYRVLEAFLCPTFDHVMSAALLRFQIVSGIWWYDSYGNVDQDGWLPNPGGNRGGHAVHGYKPAYRSRGGNIEFGIRHKNSWTRQWGVNGLVVFPERVYGSHDIGGWWCIRSVVDEGGVFPEVKQ